MPNVDDLRQAMMAETADLAPRRTVEEITRAGRRRVVRRRTGIIAVACAAAVAIAAPITVWSDDGTGGDVAAPAADPPGLISTGVPTDNGEELLLWPREDSDPARMKAGRRDPDTGHVTEILPRQETSGAAVEQPGKAASWSTWLRGPAGTFIQVGLLEGQVQRVTAKINGAVPRDVRFAEPQYPRQTGPASVVYWLADLPNATRGTVTAYDGAGNVVDTDGVLVPLFREDDSNAPPRCQADPSSAPTIGDDIRTGVTNSGGKELVVRFIKDDKGTAERAGFTVGLADPIGGTTPHFDCSFSFDLPPDPDRYRGTSGEWDGPDFHQPGGTTTIMNTFVGPVDRITATYRGRPLNVQFARWSAHPELVVYWVTGVPIGLRDDITHPKITIYDASNKVIGPK